MTTEVARTILNRLNALPRRAGKGRTITTADLLTVEQARTITSKALDGWDPDSVFVMQSTLMDIYRSLTPSGRRGLADGESVGGWFAAGPADECDSEGCFCSTPCHDYSDGEIPSVLGFKQALDGCSESGVLFLQP